jgi:glycogen synthase
MVFYDRETWQRLQRNGMSADFSWERSAHNYLEAYHRISAAKR